MNKNNYVDNVFNFVEREAGKEKQNLRIINLEVEEYRSSQLVVKCSNCNNIIIPNEKIFKLIPPKNRQGYCFLCEKCFSLFSRNEILI